MQTILGEFCTCTPLLTCINNVIVETISDWKWGNYAHSNIVGHPEMSLDA